MKIICLEEHTVDAGIARASQTAQTSEAGYMADWGSRAEDKTAAAMARPKETAAAELERAVKQLGMVGTLLMGRPGQTFLDASTGS
jgi:predicted TIM-barrel fold metal-dependent hydrolase